MDEDREADRPAPNAETTGIDRVVFFSDAVFAIAMTLLVLPLIGGRGGPDVWQRLHTQSAQLYAFALSFWVIALYWLGHHRMYRRIRAYDDPLLFLNLLLLFEIAFLPYPTALSGRYPHSVGATVFYAASLSAVGLTVTACVWYALRFRHLGDADDVTTRWFIVRGLIVPAIFLPSIGLAFASVTLARALWWLAFFAGFLARWLEPRRARGERA
jgi:uncharacterized membrane protein